MIEPVLCVRHWDENNCKKEEGEMMTTGGCHDRDGGKGKAIL